MDIYKKRSYWNVVMLLSGLALLAVTITYSNYLANQLRQNELKNTMIWKKSVDFLGNPANQQNQDALASDIRIPQEIVESFALPVILKYDDGYLEGYNWGTKKDTSTTFLSQKIEKFVDEGKEPMESYGSKIYVFNSPLLAYINYFPLIQLLLVLAFGLFGYLFFNSSKTAEQNRVWAGMAKETAHQLGTPISAIIAWIEHLKMEIDNEDQLEIIDELRNDVGRLELVADRFSKIGSDPVLVPVNVYEELTKCKRYMEKRSPRKIVFDFPAEDTSDTKININQHLFDWVIENLIRNSLDAMGSEGTIAAKVVEGNDKVTIELSDTGKGISSSDFNTVFQPGFSTKQRGWGLGLSLAKRIIESYHQGKIFVKSSTVGEGTTFAIVLNKA